ncbi:MAG: hypothetical protein AAF677_00950 [Pseudomonadota bacterium]
MGLLLLVVGIFAGLFAFLATLYSMTQAILQTGATRWVNAAVVVGMLSIMGALQYREVTAARVLAVPLMALAIWCTAREERWYKAFPILLQLFALCLILGLVVL